MGNRTKLVTMKLYFIYRLFIRNLYKKRVKGRTSAAEALANICLFSNLFTIFFILESHFNIKGIWHLSTSSNFPLAPLAMGMFIVIYLFKKLLFPFKLYSKKILMIRKAINKTSEISRTYSAAYVILSVLLFLLSLVLLMYNSRN